MLTTSISNAINANQIGPQGFEHLATEARGGSRPNSFPRQAKVYGYTTLTYTCTVLYTVITSFVSELVWPVATKRIILCPFFVPC
jgi:hypothetical protein